jgi:tetratricopeptide (TPR) repeat protein
MQKKMVAVWYVLAFSLIIAACATSGANSPHQTAETFLKRGISSINSGDYDQAIADFNKALKLDPKFAAAYYQRGRAYGNKGDNDQAIADYTQAIATADLNQATADFKQAIADHDQATADYGQVIANVTQTIKISSNFAENLELAREALGY